VAGERRGGGASRGGGGRERLRRLAEAPHAALDAAAVDVAGDGTGRDAEGEPRHRTERAPADDLSEGQPITVTHCELLVPNGFAMR
jgi:hypothetical protein